MRYEDQEIINLIEILGDEKCEIAFTAMPERMQDFAQSLYCVENTDTYTDFIIENHEKLSTVHGVKEALLACYKDPVGILKGYDIKYKPIETWLFTYAMTIEKTLTGKVLAYGLSSLAKDTGLKDSRIRFAGPQFLWRQKLFKTNEIDAISQVFANKFASVSVDQLNSLDFRTQMFSMLLQRAFYTLSNYRHFEPLRDLLIHYLENQGMPCRHVKLKTALSEFSMSNAATANYILVPPTILIYWQSCHGSHVNDKRKELSGRFRATKAKWHENAFSIRKQAEKIYLIVDGEWREEDFLLFFRSGVDGIFYPDEIDDLISQIQSDKDITIDEMELPLAAEKDITLKVTEKKQNRKRKKRR